MIQKSSIRKVLEIFFLEPTTIHFIREISRRINLAQPSVRNAIKYLLKKDLIKVKKSKPFDGLIANRDNERFIFLKKVNNLESLYHLKEKIIEEIHPRLFVVFGSYSLGEDIETSDIDILLISKTTKEINVKKFEDTLGRKINIMIVDDFRKLDKIMQKRIMNGFVLFGGF